MSGNCCQREGDLHNFKQMVLMLRQISVVYAVYKQLFHYIVN